MKPRCFTPDSARRTLLTLGPVVERVRRLFRGLESHRPPRITAEQPVDPRYFSLVCRLHRALDEIRASGARITDLRNGSVGFPARRAGRDVVLHWSTGQQRLEYWQEVGAEPLRRIDDDGPWEEA